MNEHWIRALISIAEERRVACLRRAATAPWYSRWLWRRRAQKWLDEIKRASA